MASQIAGVFREALAMSFGVRISAFNAQPESAQNAFSGFQFVGKLFELKQGFDSGEQLLREYRLAQKIIRAGFDTADPVFALRQPGDQYEWNEPSCRILFQFAAQLVTGLSRHNHV
jgi:hypothetical protein